MRRDDDRMSRRRGESGLALMMVLGVLAAAMILLSHMMLVSQLVSREAYQVTSKEELRYRAESAAETAFWLHLTDRRLFSNRTLGRSSEARGGQYDDWEPWMLDGRPHALDEGATVVYLASGESGVRVGDLKQLKDGLDASDDADAIEAIDDFIHCYDDYVDKDDLVKVNGREADEYAADGFGTLPRNGAMQFKHEIYWLPGWESVVTGTLMIVPPAGIQYNVKNSRPSFFAATDRDFQRLLKFEPDSAEMAAIHYALDEWNGKGTPIEDSLDITLLTQVRNRFSFEEPGLAIVAALAADPGREIQAGYRVTREARINSSTFYSDTHRECFAIWERIWE